MKTLVSWSTGKDSAWMLHVLRQRSDVTVAGLVTTINAAFDRVAMHGVRRTLLQAQADAAGLPLHILPIPYPCHNDVYERILGEFITAQVAQGIEVMAFGDLFLEDIRRYRQTKLAGSGIAPLFPLWGLDTRQLATDMIASGLVAHITALDPRQLPEHFAGRRFDAALLAELPPGVDPCGENGEFHTFACAGPMFRHAMAVETGAVVTRDGFVFADLLPVPRHAPPPCREEPKVGLAP
jgi:uncharacterized protein (TIGR00290 family)